MDLRMITEELITSLLTQAEVLKHQAEGARLLYVRIVEEGSKQEANEQSKRNEEQPSESGT